jgi:hypothetical protein
MAEGDKLAPPVRPRSDEVCIYQEKMSQAADWLNILNHKTDFKYHQF